MILRAHDDVMRIWYFGISYEDDDDLEEATTYKRKYHNGIRGSIDSFEIVQKSKSDQRVSVNRKLLRMRGLLITGSL
jgi:leucyl-tRNA synthetase